MELSREQFNVDTRKETQRENEPRPTPWREKHQEIGGRVLRVLKDILIVHGLLQYPDNFTKLIGVQSGSGHHLGPLDVRVQGDLQVDGRQRAQQRVDDLDTVLVKAINLTMDQSLRHTLLCQEQSVHDVGFLLTHILLQNKKQVTKSIDSTNDAARQSDKHQRVLRNPREFSV